MTPVPKQVTGRGKGRPNAPAKVTPTPKIPTAPTGLNSEGKALWRKLWTAASDFLVSGVDNLAVQMLVSNMMELKYVQDELKSGRAARFYETPQGQLLPHPYIAQSTQLKALVNSDLSALGLTPSARAKAGIVIDNETEAEKMRKLMTQDRTGGME